MLANLCLVQSTINNILERLLIEDLAFRVY